MLLYRILTAAILIPLAMLLIFKSNAAGFAIVSGGLVLIALHEWLGMLKLSQWAMVALLFVTAVLMAGGYFVLPFLVQWAVLFSLLVWLFLFKISWFYRGYMQDWLLSRPKHAVLACFCIMIAWVSINGIMQSDHGPWVLLSLLLIIWAVDSGAYFIGKYFGRYALQPFVSPNKTVEGFLGGIGMSLVAATLIHFVYGKYQIQVDIIANLPKWLAIVFCLSLVSVLGDLFESLVKRTYGVKDSGKILPGHGGVLDRLDSLIATLPFFASIVFYSKGML